MRDASQKAEIRYIHYLYVASRSNMHHAHQSRCQRDAASVVGSLKKFYSRPLHCQRDEVIVIGTTRELITSIRRY